MNLTLPIFLLEKLPCFEKKYHLFYVFTLSPKIESNFCKKIKMTFLSKSSQKLMECQKGYKERVKVQSNDLELECIKKRSFNPMTFKGEQISKSTF